MKSEKIAVTMRFDTVSLAKLKIIAKKNKRSQNAEIEIVVENAIAEFESKHGEIKVNPDDLYS